MKKFTVILSVLLLGTFLVAGSAMALPYGSNSGAALQGVLNDITIGGDSSVDVNEDYLDDSTDSYWDITASGGSIATIVIELAGFASGNSFGVYDSANNGTKVELFDGAATAGSQVTLSITNAGDVYKNHEDTGIDFAGEFFGYYLDSSAFANGGLAYSDTSLNADQLDHMAAYQGTGDLVQIDPWDEGTWTANEFILAFEDLFVNPDWDYTDFVVMVESVSPVPEPATMLLLGVGLIGLAGVSRKKLLK